MAGVMEQLKTKLNAAGQDNATLGQDKADAHARIDSLRAELRDAAKRSTLHTQEKTALLEESGARNFFVRGPTALKLVSS